MSNEHFFEEEQFVISPELLHILHWIMKYEELALSQLIAQAYYKGFEEKIKKQDIFENIQNATDLQHSVVDFLNFLENQLAVLQNQSHNKTMIHPNVMNALDHIDPQEFDFETIKSTVIATADKINPKNNIDAKKMFLKELLKQWEPKITKNQKMVMN